VSVGPPGCLHSRCVGSVRPTTTLALPGERLELRGRLGRQPDVAVGRSVRRAGGARCQYPVSILY